MTYDISTARSVRKPLGKTALVAAGVFALSGCSLLHSARSTSTSGSSAGTEVATTDTSESSESTQSSTRSSVALEPDDGIQSDFHRAHTSRVVFASAPVTGADAAPITAAQLGDDNHPTLFLEHSLRNLALQAGLDVGFGAEQGVTIEITVGGATTSLRQTFNVPVFGNATVIPLSIAGIGNRERLVWPDANDGEMSLLASLAGLPDGTHPIHVRVLLQTRPGRPEGGGFAATPPGPAVPIGEGDLTITVNAAARTALATRFGPTLAGEAFTNRRELSAIQRAVISFYGDSFVAMRSYFGEWRVETNAAGIPVRRSTVVLVVTRAAEGCSVRGADAVAAYVAAGRFETPEFHAASDPRLRATPVPCAIAE